MVERAKFQPPAPPAEPPGNSLFSEVQFIPTGSTLLDLAIGGGWAVGRIANLVGDRSTGKTLLAIEAFANFSRKFPNGRMRYGEAEAAFDNTYAIGMGFPGNVSKPTDDEGDPLMLVEEYRDDILGFIKKDEGPSLYVLDSLDALSDEAEMKLLGKKTEDGEDKGSFGAAKAKKLSQMFRQSVREIERADCCHIVISQVRENIGVMFGEKFTRSGGKALDFYASQIVWLAQVAQIKRTTKGQERVVGITVEANVKKLKVGNPYRRVKFDIIFGYGVDDEMSMLSWLGSSKVYSESDVKDLKNTLSTIRGRQDRKSLEELRVELIRDATKLWREIESNLAPPMSKY